MLLLVCFIFLFFSMILRPPSSTRTYALFPYPTLCRACSFIKVGIVPGDGGAWLLQKVLGYPRAAELFLTGDRFDAAQAKEYGLVTDVVPDAELLDRAIAIAERIVCNPPRALRLTKRLLREAQHSRMSVILELSAAYQAIAHEDRKSTRLNSSH